MKKLLLFFTLALAMVLTSCTSGPSSTAKKVLDGAKDAKYEQVVDNLGDKDGNALNDDAKKALLDMINSKADKNKNDKIASYDITSEEVAEDGKSAVVKYTVTYEDGKTKEDSMKLIKGEDGVWRMPFGK